MKKNMFGFIVIIIGILLLGYQADIWDLNLFFDGWWTLFILIPGIISIVNKKFIEGLLCISIGLLLLLASNDIIEWNLIGPIFLIVCGISIILNGVPKVETKNILKGDYLALFSSNDAKINGKFENTNLTCVLGGIDLDLRNAEIKKSNKIVVFCLFGGVDILVPNDVNIKVIGSPIFGSIENKVVSSSNKIIEIECICLFGEITIK